MFPGLPLPAKALVALVFALSPRVINFVDFCFNEQTLRQACKSVATMKGIQTLDLSNNRLSAGGALALAKSLSLCRSLHEIVLEESVQLDDTTHVR